MMKTAFASAAVLGAVMVAPAHATVPAQGAYTFVTSGFVTALQNWTSAWSGYFGGVEPTFNLAPVPPMLGGGFVINYTFSNITTSRIFAQYFSSGGSPTVAGFAMPVPGPIAGAGLPLLAAGIAFAAWRRRRAANAA